MVRTKFIFGALFLIFSLLYLEFGIVGFFHDGINNNTIFCFFICFVHVLVGGGMLLSSHQDRKKQQIFLEKLFITRLQSYPYIISAKDLADKANVAPEVAQNFLRAKAHEISAEVIENNHGELLHIIPFYALN